MIGFLGWELQTTSENDFSRNEWLSFTFLGVMETRFSFKSLRITLNGQYLIHGCPLVIKYEPLEGGLRHPKQLSSKERALTSNLKEREAHLSLVPRSKRESLGKRTLESIQVAVEDAREVQITNQATAKDGSLTQKTLMDPKLYVATAHGDIHVLEQYDIHVQLTSQKNTVLHVVAQFHQANCVNKKRAFDSSENLIDSTKKLGEEDTERGAAVDCKVMLRTITNDKDSLARGSEKSSP
ncbi:hypothetical protein CK203_110856 [Vitis vinifera]|uniref:Uncharacterized protein n=1 Tax=Vitis vinifera TaxID=29760 RepID=A0A438CRP0_VITVI|nr:hypothetical protein CK203_110856 [Vitis vinifera]